MKTKIISIAIGTTVFIISNVFGYNIYKNTDNQNAEDLKSNFVKYEDEGKENNERNYSYTTSNTEIVEDVNSKNSSEITEDVNSKNNTEIKEDVNSKNGTQIAKDVNSNNNTQITENANSQNNKENGGTNITNIYTYNQATTSTIENKEVNINQNNQYNTNNNTYNESKDATQNTEKTEQKNSVSKFTAYRVDKEMPYATFFIDVDLDKKTANCGLKIDEEKADLRTINLNDSQVDQLRRIYKGDFPTESYPEVYYQIDSEEYYNDCRQVFVTSKDNVELLEEIIDQYVNMEVPYVPVIHSNNK